jgi:hypothetical protein
MVLTDLVLIVDFALIRFVLVLGLSARLQRFRQAKRLAAGTILE